MSPFSKVDAADPKDWRSIFNSDTAHVLNVLYAPLSLPADERLDRRFSYQSYDHWGFPEETLEYAERRFFCGWLWEEFPPLL